MRWRNNSSQISLYIKLVLLSLNHIGEDSNATNTLLSMFTEATRYCIINTTGYTPFAPRSFEPPNTTITMCKKLNTVVCGSSDDSQFDVFSMSGLDLIYISLREKIEISEIFLNILIIIQGRITENLSLIQNAICALRIVNCHMTGPVIKEIMLSFRGFVFFETTDSDHCHAFLFISFPVICWN